MNVDILPCNSHVSSWEFKQAKVLASRAGNVEIESPASFWPGEQIMIKYRLRGACIALYEVSRCTAAGSSAKPDAPAMFRIAARFAGFVTDPKDLDAGALDLVRGSPSAQSLSRPLWNRSHAVIAASDVK